MCHRMTPLCRRAGEKQRGKLESIPPRIIDNRRTGEVRYRGETGESTTETEVFSGPVPAQCLTRNDMFTGPQRVKPQ